MRTRLLGSALVILAILGGLNLVQALKRTGHHEGTRSDAPVALAQDTAEGRIMIDQSFKVQAGQRLFVDVQHADLAVETTTGEDARIVVTLESPDMAEAVEKFEKMNFVAESDASGIRLTSRMDDAGTFEGFWDNVRMTIRVEVVIPQVFDLDLASTHGDVALASHQGVVRLSTTHGDVAAESLTGDAISIETTHGDLAASNLAAGTITLATTHGDIALGTVTGDLLEARTTHSDVAIEVLSAKADVETTHGDVAIAVRETSGLHVATTHGDVALDLPKDLSADLDLEGDPVTLESAATFDGKRDEKHLVGTVNGGGARVEVSTTFGTVRVGS